MISKLMRDVLEDLTKDSLDKIEKYVKPVVVAPVVVAAEGEAAPEPVRTLEMARQRGGWLFIFEAARAPHLDAGDEEDLVLRFEKRKQEEETSRTRSVGVVRTEEAKIFYFMNNLNDSIFETVKANFMELSTRVLFPDTYDEIKPEGHRGVRPDYPEKTSDRIESNQGRERQAL